MYMVLSLLLRNSRWKTFWELFWRFLFSVGLMGIRYIESGSSTSSQTYLVTLRILEYKRCDDGCSCRGIYFKLCVLQHQPYLAELFYFANQSKTWPTLNHWQPAILVSVGVLPESVYKVLLDWSWTLSGLYFVYHDALWPLSSPWAGA